MLQLFFKIPNNFKKRRLILDQVIVNGSVFYTMTRYFYETSINLVFYLSNVYLFNFCSVKLKCDKVHVYIVTNHIHYMLLL